jgi:hypothetical protein
MQRVRRNANNVTWLHGIFFPFRANAQNAVAFQDVKNLLRIIMFVQRRRLSRLNDHDKDFGRFGVRPVHYQVVDMRRKLVSLDPGCGKDKFHSIMDL